MTGIISKSLIFAGLSLVVLQLVWAEEGWSTVPGWQSSESTGWPAAGTGWPVGPGWGMFDETQIASYHFHVYFFQGVQKSVQDALHLRLGLITEVNKGVIPNCIVKAVNFGAYGPHQVGNYEMCCNRTSVDAALSFLMLNHGQLPVLLHPLTKQPKLDHDGRSMFLGPRIPINLDALPDEMDHEPDQCTSDAQNQE